MSDTPSDAVPQRPQPRLPAYGGPQQPRPAWPGAPAPPPPPQWVIASRAKAPAVIRARTLWAVLATGILAALLLDGGVGLNLLFVAAPAAVAAALAARAAGRRPRPWTLVWAAAGIALLAVPALRDAGWPASLAIVAALALGSLALHGGRTWPGVLFGSVGVWGEVVSGLAWGLRGLRGRTGGSRDRWWPVVRAAAVAVVLLVVFGALFAGADAAFADLLGNLTPDVSVGDSPLHFLFFVLGLVGALAVARTAASPRRWDLIEVKPGRARSRLEWTLPLVVLAALFALFNAVQLTVLFGGYDKVLAETGQTYAEYARQGFWQLLTVTLLTVLVIALALRWAPRGTDRDRLLVRSVLGAICLLTLVVVASALRRMELYVNAYGLTRLRISVAGMELWLGLVIVLIMAAGILGNRWLPRAIVASAAAGILAFGLASPDGLIADQQVTRYENTGKIDLGYLRGLSADAVPALDRLPEPQRSCALGEIEGGLHDGEAWYATSLGEARARTILADRPLAAGDPCQEAGFVTFRE
ncbi:MAG: hypothetical protein QOF84_4129 [Streptomyces sp.]|nr:hypothetical protein [Streptomyces sp.]